MVGNITVQPSFSVAADMTLMVLSPVLRGKLLCACLIDSSRRSRLKLCVKWLYSAKSRDCAA